MENDQKPNQKLTFMRATNLAFELGFMIALPLVAFGLLGKYLDSKWGTSYMVLVGILLAIISTSIWLSKRIKSILEDLRK